MASKARADAARRNGAKSEGPVTPEGKAKSSKNAITNGLYTDVILLQGENAELFARLHQVITDIYKPRNEEECMLVRDLIHNRWKLERMRQYHSAAIDDELTQQAPIIDSQYTWMHYSTRGARAFRELCDESGTLEMYERMDTRLQNAILRLGKYIRDLQERTPDAGLPGAGGGTTDSQHQQQQQDHANSTAAQAAPASGPLSLAQSLSRNFFLPTEESAPRRACLRTPKPAILSLENEHPAIGNEPSESPKYFVAGAESAPSPEPILSTENEHLAIGNEPSEPLKYLVAGAESTWSPEPILSTENEHLAIGNEPSEPLKYFVAGAESAWSPEPIPSPENEHLAIGNEPSEPSKYLVAGAAFTYSSEPIPSPKNEYPAIGNEPSEPLKYFAAGAASTYTSEPVPSPKNEYPAIGNEPSEPLKYFVAGAAAFHYSSEPVPSPKNDCPAVGDRSMGNKIRSVTEPRPRGSVGSPGANHGLATERWFAIKRPRPSKPPKNGLHSGVP